MSPTSRPVATLDRLGIVLEAGGECGMPLGVRGPEAAGHLAVRVWKRPTPDAK